MDENTLKRAIRGNKSAFSKVYNEYFNDLWRYVFSRLKNKEIASDIVSESFIALYENLKNIKYPKAIKSYLYKIAKNKMIKFYSEEKTLLLSEFELDRLEINLEENSKTSKKWSVRLEEVLSKLPKNYEDILRLRFLSGLKIKEVAEILNKTENNVKVLQNRAIKRAKEIIFNLYNIKC